MSIFTDTDLLNLRQSGKLIIEPFQDVRLTPVGYNLSVGKFYVSKRKLRRIDLSKNEEFVIGPGETIAIRTLENIELPKDRSVSGLVLSKIKMIKAGFGHISTTVDADHCGHMIVVVQNISKHESKIVQGQPFCTLIFLKNSTPSTKQSNNTYDEYEIVKDLIDAWSGQRPILTRKLWRVIKMVLPILFVVIGSIGAILYFGLKAVPFTGVIAVIGTIGVLMEKYLNR